MTVPPELRLSVARISDSSHFRCLHFKLILQKYVIVRETKFHLLATQVKFYRLDLSKHLKHEFVFTVYDVFQLRLHFLQSVAFYDYVESGGLALLNYLSLLVAFL